jgi:hypothetical protein
MNLKIKLPTLLLSAVVSSSIFAEAPVKELRPISSPNRAGFTIVPSNAKAKKASKLSREQKDAYKKLELKPDKASPQEIENQFEKMNAQLDKKISSKEMAARGPGKKGNPALAKEIHELRQQKLNLKKSRELINKSLKKGN